MAELLPPNIVIIGSWRSGTTLLFELFQHAFKDVTQNEAESDALDTLLPSGYKWRVSKRPNDAHHIRAIIEKIDPYFIYMLRDPRDCITSWRDSHKSYYMSFNEWMRNLLFAESGKSSKIFFQKFENLVLHPGQVQNDLCKKIVGLEKKYSLKECYTFINENSPIAFQLSHYSNESGTGEAIRAMDPTVIGSWKQHKRRIVEQLTDFPELQAALEKYGYEKDASWQNQLKDLS